MGTGGDGGGRASPARGDGQKVISPKNTPPLFIFTLIKSIEAASIIRLINPALFASPVPNFQGLSPKLRGSGHSRARMVLSGPTDPPRHLETSPRPRKHRRPLSSPH